MKKYLFYTLVCISCVILMASSCKKDKPVVDRPLTFQSLTAEKDTLFPGEVTPITAIADGDGISYSWSATAGDVVGSGSVISYVTPPCVVGSNNVTCVVKDKADNKLSKTVTIVVL